MNRSGAHTLVDGSRPRSRMRLLLLLAIALVATVRTEAQYPRWAYDQVTAWEYDKVAPDVEIDRWGVHHILFGTRDIRRSGLQLFIVDDATGSFGRPVQVSDTGVVVDSVMGRPTPFLLGVDPKGGAHVAFVANVGNHFRLYYTDNVGGSFTAARLLDDVAPFDMAVDSFGYAHIVWVDESTSPARIEYWNSYEGGAPRLIGTYECYVDGLDCRTGRPQIEVGSTGLVIAYRFASGIVHMVRGTPQGGFSPPVALPLPTFDDAAIRAGRVDLRLALSIDRDDHPHLALPFFDSTGHRLLYATDRGGLWTHRSVTAGRLDTICRAFDVSYDGEERLHIVWSSHRPIRATDVPNVSHAELRLRAGTVTIARLDTPLVTTEGADPRGSWLEPTAIASRGSLVAIGGSVAVESDSAVQQSFLLRQTATAPRIAYLHPDAAAPGMNVVVETYAHQRERGAFGPDGLRPAVVELELVRPADSARLVVGPTVVSWEGRLASTMLFIPPDAEPGGVPVRLRVDGVAGSVDTFFVVHPQTLGVAGHLTGGGRLGSGGPFGSRSKRGVLVVDSLILVDGRYTVDTTDVDPDRPGNQGFLPITILARGDVRIERGASLSVSGWNDAPHGLYGTGGPGGGGGGSGGEFAGGSGYTGGAGAPRNPTELLFGRSVGSGSERSALWHGGGSLNGAPGGGIFLEGAGGGGTGHPFGSSGNFGRVATGNPIFPHRGGNGGGTGGVRSLEPGASTGGGGGGGNGTDGDHGGDATSSNAGRAVGNRQIVPLAGGSGGGGGGYASGGYATGGGGGGALALYSFGRIHLSGTIEADGGEGSTSSQAANASGGGGGAGGSILLGGRDGFLFDSTARLSAQGGRGGRGNGSAGMGGRPGGDGGRGRIRLDGRGSVGGSDPEILWRGPATVASGRIQAGSLIDVSGSGMPGTRIRLYVRSDRTGWNYDAPREAMVQADSSWRLTLPPIAGAERYYVVALQQTNRITVSRFVTEPEWIMSTAGGNVAGRARSSIGTRSLDFGCLRFDSCASAPVPIANSGELADLRVTRARVVGPDAARFSVPNLPQPIPAGGSGSLMVRFCPGDTGTFRAQLELSTSAWPDSTLTIDLVGCGASGLPGIPHALSIGDLCADACLDTTILVENIGSAPLPLLGLSDDAGVIAVSVPAGILPREIAPGERFALPVTLCPRSSDVTTTTLSLRTRSIDSVVTLPTSFRSRGPLVSLPSTLTFPEAIVDDGTVCQRGELQIINRHPLDSLEVKVAQPTDSSFRLPAGAIVAMLAPAETLRVEVEFCAGEPGSYSGSVSIELGSGSCRSERAVALEGRARRRGHAIDVVEPEDHELWFTPELIGATSPARPIILVNRGDLALRLEVPTAVGLPGTDDQSLHLSLPGSLLLDVGDSLHIDVAVRPTTLGDLRGMVLLRTADDRWFDTVRIFGSGVAAGLRPDRSRLDFGLLRLGSDSLLTFSIGNSGTAPATIDSVRVDDPRFVVASTSASLPAAVAPGGTPLEVTCRFVPESEGEATATATIYTSDGEHTVALRGRSGLERPRFYPDVVDLACVEAGRVVDSVDLLLLRNDGTYPLRLDSLTLAGGEDLSLLGTVAPMMLAPGASIPLGVRYRARAPFTMATITLHSSAPSEATARIRGERCPDTGLPGDLLLSDVGGRVGEEVRFDVGLQLRRPLPAGAPIEIELRYDEELLLPLVPPHTSWEKSLVAGGVVEQVEAIEREPGLLRISGRLAAVPTGELVAGIPFRILLGRRYRTSVVPLLARLNGGPVGLLDTGSVVATDCDTTGGAISSLKYTLKQNVPNPFGPRTTISYSLAKEGEVTISLFDAGGALVRVLHEGVEPAGEHTLVVPTGEIPAGIYYYELRSGDFRKVLRLVVAE